MKPWLNMTRQKLNAYMTNPIATPSKQDQNGFKPPSRMLSFFLPLLLVCLWLIGFKTSANLLGTWHLPLFGGFFLLAILITVYRATRQLNQYLAKVITDHRWLAMLIEARISCFILALLLSALLTLSALVFVFNLHYQAWWILLTGFSIVAGLMLKLTFHPYLKAEIHDFSRAYVSVLFGAGFMLIAQLVWLLNWPPVRFEPMTIELLEFVRAQVNHPEILFQHLARTALYIEHNILALAQVDGFSPWLVASILLLTTSIVPFMALALFMRSLYELVLRLQTRQSNKQPKIPAEKE